MPLSAKGQKIMAAMRREYGAKKAESVFYASKNSGKISGVDATQVLGKVVSDQGSESQAMQPPNPVESSPLKQVTVPAGDSLPTKDQFRRQFRDAMWLGNPLPKCLALGTIWTGKSTPSQDSRLFFKGAVKDALLKGLTADKAIKLALSKVKHDQSSGP
jgi:hypothetical protein